MPNRSGQPWSALLRRRAFWSWEIGAQLVRLVPMMFPFAFVYLGDTVADSVRVGGLMVMTAILGGVGMAPFNGRLLDRVGTGVGLPAMLGTASGALAVLAVAVSASASGGVLVGLAAVVGVLSAGLSGGYRSTLTPSVGPDLVEKALAADAIIVEVMVSLVPLIVLGAARFGAGAVIWTMVALYLIATAVAWFRRGTDRDARTAGASTTTRGSLFASTEFRYWFVISVAFGHVLSSVEAGSQPLMSSLGRARMDAAWLVIGLTVASVTGGLAYATFSGRMAMSEIQRANLACLVMIGGTIGLSFATDYRLVLIAVAVIGVAIAPINIVRQVGVERSMSPDRYAEAFATMYAGNGIGFALGGFLLAVLPLTAMLLAPIGVCIVALVMSRAVRPGRAGQ